MMRTPKLPRNTVRVMPIAGILYDSIGRTGSEEAQHVDMCQILDKPLVAARIVDDNGYQQTGVQFFRDVRRARNTNTFTSELVILLGVVFIAAWTDLPGLVAALHPWAHTSQASTVLSALRERLNKLVGESALGKFNPSLAMRLLAELCSRALSEGHQHDDWNKCVIELSRTEHIAANTNGSNSLGKVSSTQKGLDRIWCSDARCEAVSSGDHRDNGSGFLANR